MSFSRFFLAAFLSLMLFCSSSLSGFSTKNIYIADSFNERTLSGFSIGLGPVLTKQGFDMLDSLNSDELYKYIKSIRSDLRLVPFNQTKKQWLAKSGKNWCDSLFLKLYYEKTFEIQLMDSLWHSMSSDYFMMIRVLDAMHIKTFGNAQKRRIRLEAELWNRKDQEVVWRMEVHSIANGINVSDRQLINKSVAKVYEKLPKTTPSYENTKW